MILSINKFLPVRECIKAEGKKLVFTNGCFDILHAGHVHYLREAKNLGDYLIVGLNSDSSVKILKGESRPVNQESDRALILDSLKAVDFVILFEEETPFNLISAILPDVLVKGGDYKIENIVGADVVFQNGGDVVVLPFVEGKSTSAIIEKILKI